MGVWYYYYSAPSDEAAASTINRIGEQGMPSEDPFLRTKLPVMALRNLEVLLTGREYHDVADFPFREVEIENPHNDPDFPTIVALTDSISAALADADDERLAAVMVSWSQIDEGWDWPEEKPEERVRWQLPWLRELAVLARRTRERSERLYCWWMS